MQIKSTIEIAGVTLLMLAGSSFTVYAGNIDSNPTIDFNESSKYSGLATPVTETSILITEDPSDNSEPVGVMNVGTAVEIVRKDEEWTKVKSGEIEGWVKTVAVVTGYNMEAYILDAGENFNRTGTVIDPDTQLEMEEGTGEVIAVLKEGQEVKIVQEFEDYLYVKADEYSGYIPKSKVDAAEVEFTDATKYEEATAPVELPQVESTPNWFDFEALEIDLNADNGYTPDDETEVRKQMVNYALQFLGHPYVYGGTSLTTGIDCSAFVQNIYRNFGVSLPRTSREQSKVGRRIDYTELRPGDLLFYYDAGTTRVGHVTMYIGNNTIVHASNPKNGIILSSVGYREPCWCVRIIEDEKPIQEEEETDVSAGPAGPLSEAGPGVSSSDTEE